MDLDRRFGPVEQHHSTKMPPSASTSTSRSTAKRRFALLGENDHQPTNTLNTLDSDVPSKRPKPSSPGAKIGFMVKEFQTIEQQNFKPVRSRSRRTGKRHEQVTLSDSGSNGPSIERHSSISSVDELQNTPARNVKDAPNQPQPNRKERLDKQLRDNVHFSSEDELIESAMASQQPHKDTPQPGQKPVNIDRHEPTASEPSPPGHKLVAPVTPDKATNTISSFTIQSPSPRSKALVGTSHRFCVRAAVCGSSLLEHFDWVFPSRSYADPGLIAAQQANSPEVPMDASLWAEIKCSKIRSVKYAENCEFAQILRSASSASNQRIAIRFSSPDECKNFIRALRLCLLDTHDKILSLRETSWLKSVFERSLISRQDAKPLLTETPGTTVAENLRKHDDLPQTPTLIPGQAKRDHEKIHALMRSFDDDVSNSAEKTTSRSLASRATRSSGPADSPQGLVWDRPRRQAQLSLFYRKDLWTESNPGWRDRWKETLVYPRIGKNRANVEQDDIERLNEGTFLNDNIILCYINYLQRQRENSPDTQQAKVYFMNTYFFGMVKPSRGAGINYEAVKKWTASVDLFEYDYIVVPVNEAAHWYIAIICHPGKLIPSPQDQDDDSDASDAVAAISLNETPTSARMRNGLHAADSNMPRIITLDSLGHSHSFTCKVLREYLMEELEARKGIEIERPMPFGLTAKNIPLQDNGCDCGVFVLGFIESFLKDPAGFTSAIMAREAPVCDFEPSKLRHKIRDTLFELQDEYAAESARLEAEARAQKSARKKARRAAAAAYAASSSVPPSPTPNSPAPNQESSLLSVQIVTPKPPVAPRNVSSPITRQTSSPPIRGTVTPTICQSPSLNTHTASTVVRLSPTVQSPENSSPPRHLTPQPERFVSQTNSCSMSSPIKPSSIANAYKAGTPSKRKRGHERSSSLQVVFPTSGPNHMTSGNPAPRDRALDSPTKSDSSGEESMSFSIKQSDEENSPELSQAPKRSRKTYVTETAHSRGIRNVVPPNQSFEDLPESSDRPLQTKLKTMPIFVPNYPWQKPQRSPSKKCVAGPSQSRRPEYEPPKSKFVIDLKDAPKSPLSPSVEDAGNTVHLSVEDSSSPLSSCSSSVQIPNPGSDKPRNPLLSVSLKAKAKAKAKVRNLDQSHDISIGNEEKETSVDPFLMKAQTKRPITKKYSASLSRSHNHRGTGDSGRHLLSRERQRPKPPVFSVEDSD